MNAKALIPLIAGLGIAGLAAKLGLDYVNKAKGSPVKTVQLWAPVQDVPRGVAVTEAVLKPVPFPARLAPRGALTDKKQIVGRVPHTGCPAGLPILDSMLLPPGERPGLRVPPGYRAVAVKIDESSGVDNHLEPGCHVDVVGVFSIRRNGRNETLAKTLIEDVEVAAVGPRLAPASPAPAGKEGGKKTTRRERPPRAVTLLVKPDQVPILHLAEQRGRIKLAMRGLSDTGRNYRAAQIDEEALIEGTEQDAGVQEDPGDLAGKLGGLLAGLLGKHEQDDPEPPSAAAVVQQPPQPASPPQPRWVMVVFNGDERQMFGWMDMNSRQPIELTAGEPTIFNEPATGPAWPPLAPPTGKSLGGHEQPIAPPAPPAGIEPGTRASSAAAAGSSGVAGNQTNDEDTGSDTQSEPKEQLE